MYTLGPYTFTETDAARTIANFDGIWLELCRGRDACSIEALRPVLDPGEDTASALEQVWAALLAAGPALRAAGQLPASTTGVVAQLNTSDGGVPKLPVDRVEVGWSGVKGDRQRSRQHHGRPWQALCLWSTEVIAAFAADGHALAAGNAGENVTLSGIPWELVRPGVRLQLGDVLCEVSSFALPCSKNARWFVGGDFNLMHHERGPVSRAYATVLVPGFVSVGDTAILEP